MVEKAVLRETHEMLQFDPAFDRAAEVMDLSPRPVRLLAAERPAPHRQRRGSQRVGVDGIHDASSRPAR